MYKRRSKEESRWGVFEVMKEQLFCILYPTLLRICKEFNELTPTEVWYEAIDYSRKVKQWPRPDMMREELEDILNDEYIRFETADGVVERSEEQAQRTMFLVMVTMLYILATESKNLPDNPYKPHCLMLAEATQNHALRERFLNEVRETETAEELKGRCVEMVKMELEAESDNDGLTRSQIVNDLVDCALQYDEDVIKNQILVVSDLNDQYNGEFTKQEQRLKGALKKLVKSGHEGEAIQAQTEALKEIAKMPKQQFTVYPQAGSTANLGCQMQSPEFKVIPPSKEKQPALESCSATKGDACQSKNKEGDENV